MKGGYATASETGWTWSSPSHNSTWDCMCLSGDEIDSKGGISRVKVIDFINPPDSLPVTAKSAFTDIYVTIQTLCRPVRK